MAKGYSKDLRVRAVSIVEAGESAREAARLLDVGASTAIRWIERWTTTGSVDAKPGTGHCRSPLEQAQAVAARSDRRGARPDARGDPRAAALARRSRRPASARSGASTTVTTSPSKKTLHAAEQDRPDVAAGRAALKAEQPTLHAPRLVFIDETAVTTKMVRHYGRSPRGERLVASVPHGHWKTLTLVAALRIDGLTAPYVIDGAMDGPSFLAYVEQVLAPTLRKGDIVFMDNLRTHSCCTANRCDELVGQDLFPEQGYDTVNATATQEINDWFGVFFDGFYSERDFYRHSAYATATLNVPQTNAWLSAPPGSPARPTRSITASSTTLRRTISRASRRTGRSRRDCGSVSRQTGWWKHCSPMARHGTLR